MDFRETIEYENWQYRILSYENFQCIGLKYKKFVELWHDKKRGRSLPARSDFIFEDFKELFGWVCIYKVRHNPFDMELTLHGSKVADVDLKCRTGMMISELLDHPIERPYVKHYLEQHKQAAESHIITRSVGIELHNQKACGVEWIGLPCADDGEIASHFITITNICMLNELDEIII